MKRNTSFLAACAILLLLPVLFFNWKPNQVSGTENRMLAEPTSIKSGLSAYMKSLDDCASDRIGFREELVRLYRKVMVHFNYMSDGTSVTIGTDGWLFYNDDIPDYTGSNINIEQINYQSSILKAISDWCQQRNITFVFMVGPNKSTVYSQHMPPYIQQAENTRLDILLEKLTQEGVLTVCPKKELIRDRESDELYYKLDTHWNLLGSQYALNELVEKLNLVPKKFPTDISFIDTGDLKNMLGVSEYPSRSKLAEIEQNKDASIEPIPNTQDRIINFEDGHKFIGYRDSFSEALIDYYSYYFTGPIYWNYKIDFDLVEKEAPELLILECVERGLSWDAIEVNADIFERK